MANNQQSDLNMRGGLFPNANKAKETAPDYKGQCEMDGKKFWIAAWVKEGRSNFLSLSFEEFTEKDYQKSTQLAQVKTLSVQPVVTVQPVQSEEPAKSNAWQHPAGTDGSIQLQGNEPADFDDENIPF